MTVVSGRVVDVSGRPLEGVLWARTSMFRPDGSQVFAPEAVPYLIESGVVSADLAPGPAVLSWQFEGRPPHRVSVSIPDEPISFADLIGEP